MSRIVFTRSNSISPDPRVERTAGFLQRAGYLCTALGWSRQRQGQQWPPSALNILNIRRMYFPGQFGGGLANFLGLLVFNIWLFIQHLKIRPGVIHAFDLDTVLPALLARFVLKNCVVYDIADWYADSRRLGFLRSLIENTERWVCKKADLVILPHEDRLQQLGFTPGKWLLFYNTPEDAAVSGVTDRIPSDINNITGPSFAYVGVLQWDRGIPQMIDAAVAAGVKLIIAGFGPLDNYCLEVANREPGIVFYGKVSYGEALSIEKNTTAILAFYSPELRNNHFAAPNKLFEAMMLGRPLVTTRDISLGRFVESEGMGMAVPYGDTGMLAGTLASLASDRALCKEMGEKARHLYETRYSFSRQCVKLLAAYERLLAKST